MEEMRSDRICNYLNNISWQLSLLVYANTQLY